MYKRLNISNFAQIEPEDKRGTVRNIALGTGAVAAGLGAYHLSKGNLINLKFARPKVEETFDEAAEKANRMYKRRTARAYKQADGETAAEINKNLLARRQAQIDKMAREANENLADRNARANATRPTKELFRERVDLGKQLRRTPNTPENERLVDELKTRRAILRGELADSMKWNKDHKLSDADVVSTLRASARDGLLEEGDFGAYNTMYKRLQVSNFGLYDRLAAIPNSVRLGIAGAGIVGTGALANAARQDALNQELPADERRNLYGAAARGAGYYTAGLGGVLAAATLASRRKQKLQGLVGQ